MNRTVVAAALAINVAWFGTFALAVANAAELKVTAYEAGLDSTETTARSVETIKLDGTKGEDAAPLVTYKVRVLVTVDDAPVWTAKFRSEPMDEAACAAFLETDKIKDSVNGLTVVAREKMHPDAKVAVSCEAQPAE